MGVQVWTFGCINCKNTLANLRALYNEHQAEKFEVVGIHSPEFSHEEGPEAIGEATVDLGVTWPITLDIRKFNFFRWQGGRVEASKVVANYDLVSHQRKL